MADLSQSITYILAVALARRLGGISGLTVRKSKTGPMTRTLAVVFPSRSTISDDPTFPGEMSTEWGIQGMAIAQIQDQFFEIALRVTDLNDEGQVGYYKDQIVAAVSGYQPYIGSAGSSHTSLSPFKMTGASRRQSYRLPSGEVVQDFILTAMVRWQMFDGSGIRLTKNENENLDEFEPVDILGPDTGWLPL